MSTPTSEGTPVRTPWRDSCRRTSASSPSGRPPAACRRARSPTRGSRASSGGGPGCLKISPVPLLVRLGRRPPDVVPPAALDALEGSPVDAWLEDRKSVVQGKSVYVRVVLGGPRIITKKNQTYTSGK